ncbi:MAG: UDP-N-acetylglucosamine 2-epimerase (non-hydrolyzing) [Bryobacterales bacterium]|nr:UDP-N-acetylglucosamine 2-epimerase (non-hydrolyzing) [Bryobacterales bacterium]
MLGLPSPPAGVVVVGDVNSTVACALAAVKLHIPVAHLEAGLRSMDRMMPEEINRLVTDAVSDVLLVSEPDGMTNLQKEGIQGDRVHYVGNIMIDSLVAHLEAASTTNAPAKYGLEKVPYALVTLHRPSNVDDPERLMALARSLERVATKLPIVFPAHPRTQQKLDELNVLRLEGNINIVEPLPYFEMLSLQKGATVVITDSGGIQEETSYLGIPCLTLRENTERPVTVALGTNTLIPGSPEQIQDHVDAILAGNYRLSQAIPGWDGKTAERVVNLLDKVW